MSESDESIEQLEAGIRRRLQLLAAQDLVVLSALVAAGAFVIAFFLLKLELFQSGIREGIGTGGRLVLSGVPVVAAGVLLALRRLLKKRGRWRSKLDTDPDQVDLIIDQTLELDDRVRTAGSIIRGGGPASLMETALVEDTASRLAGSRPEQFAAYRPPRLDSPLKCYTSVACSIVLALIALVALLQYRIATHGGQGLDSSGLAVMRAVGDDLEKTTNTIAQSVGSDTPTAELARQQADLAHELKEAGRGSRTRPIERSQALKELSAIGEKLGNRKNELENTRASEILSIAERRLQSAVSGTASFRRDQLVRHQGTGETDNNGKNGRADKPDAHGDQGADHKDSAGRSAPRHGTVVPDNKSADTKSSEDKGRTGDLAEKQGQAAEAAPGKAGDESSNQNQRGVADQLGDSRKPDGADLSSRRSATPSTGDRSQDDPTLGGRQPDDGSSANKDDAQSGPPKKDRPLDPMNVALPNLSEDLMKKAAEMRANNLTPADIEQFRKAAEGLLKDLSAKDLANLANSKEIQQTLEQLARQVNPQQMEALARQLLSQKEIRDELQAVGKLLAQNREAKEAIAGFADEARDMARQFRAQGYKPPGFPNDLASSMGASQQAGSGAGSQPGSAQGGAPRSHGRSGNGAEALNGRGSRAGRPGESAKHATTELDPGSEPVYGRARPGSAPARVPYSAAYPGYRREAERSVQRSQVPPRMRDLIRNYFDAINPDATKRP
jgi:hypothetical protein